jgi:hypothetical protein
MTYAEFWPRYLAAHANKRTRALHYFGTGAALLMLVAFAATRSWWWLVAAPIVGYGLAWTAHFAFEHNKPETFGHPFWSFYSDFRMLLLFLAGRLGSELRRVTRES